MIDCPKCGFSQPKDQFCANCGIDMQRYAQNHPSPPGLGAWLSAGTLILAVALGIVLLRPLFQAPLSPQELALEEERIESFGRFNLGERRELSSLPEEPLQVEPAFETTRPLDPAPTVQEENLEPHFSLVLVSATDLARWIRDASDFSSGRGLSSGLLSPEELTGLGPDDRVAAPVAGEVLDTGWSLMTPISELGLESAGFSIEADLDENLLELVALNISPEQRIQSGVSTWHETEVSQRWLFDLRSGEILFVVGLLPRPPQVPRAAPWSLPGLFELWDMEEFVEGDRELVLLVQTAR